jgi:hypothetical protein
LKIAHRLKENFNNILKCKFSEEAKKFKKWIQIVKENSLKLKGGHSKKYPSQLLTKNRNLCDEDNVTMQ